MAKPASVPTWASDTNYSSGTQSGLSTKLEPSSGVKAQGALPDTSAPARWYNWLFNLFTQWCAYLDNLHAESAFLGANYTWTGTQALGGSVETTYSSARTRTLLVPLSSGLPGPVGTVQATANGIRLKGNGTNSAYVEFDLDKIVPSGATITNVRICVMPQNGENTLSLVTVTHNKAVPAPGTVVIVTNQADNGTSTAQIITSGAISLATNRATIEHVLTVYGGAGSGDDDELYWVEVTFTETRATGHY